MKKLFSVAIIALVFASCKKDSTPAVTGKDINTAEKASIDRFSAAAGHLMVRSASNGLPAANAPINFDNGPFITTGLDRTGAVVKYYNFDVQSTTPDDIYVLFKNGAATPVAGQNNIIPTIPGDPGYNDFWIVNKVTVPDNYVPNSLTSETEVLASGYAIIKTNTIVNCQVVPFGSTAARSKTAGVASTLTLGWYKGKALNYFNFDEAGITATAAGKVPTSPIYVTFNINPDPANPASGPASGFKAEAANAMQTHNVLATLPTDAGYSPLWDVSFLDNMHFSMISNLTTAIAAMPVSAGATVNCPVVK